MKIVRILKNSNALLSVYNDIENGSEFRLLFKRWNDIEFLYDFFESNQRDLPGITIEDAVERILSDAERLENLMVDTAVNEMKNLQTIFKPLSPSEYRLKSYQKEKAYGTYRNSWLRVYAVRIHEDLYVITGGAIKLTRTMQERKHTNEQLIRLNHVRNYLKSFGFNDNDIDNLKLEI